MPQRQDLTAAQWSEDLDALVKVITSEDVAPFDYVSEVVFGARSIESGASFPGFPVRRWQSGSGDWPR